YGILEKNLEIERISPENDRFMLCGSPSLLADMQKLLDSWGFEISPRLGEQGDYVIERAFVES
ncbi:MAG: ferredoxin--NADP reductase, partial [Enterobacterales bacterium]|nr:ferredoxin--NADP reductase [Enterobacterales bacterium]